jgi:hypothetical protein
MVVSITYRVIGPGGYPDIDTASRYVEVVAALAALGLLVVLGDLVTARLRALGPA